MNKFKKYDELCHSIGGIHRAIQLLEALALRAQFFDTGSAYPITTADMRFLIRQYKKNSSGFFQNFMPSYRVWESVHPLFNNELKGMDLYVVHDFLDWLDHKINHGVFVPENIYFSTMERIEDLRKGLNKKASV